MDVGRSLRRIDLCHAKRDVATGTLLDYGIPRADTLPAIAIDFSPVPSTTNPLGAKGAGEGGVASTPTVMNAILDALAPLGITDVPMPATPERIWRAIRDYTAMPPA
jgi:carbon-monoxide dehydrogenase large subunit